jgi:hypothetical protein
MQAVGSKADTGGGQTESKLGWRDRVSNSLDTVSLLEIGLHS